MALLSNITYSINNSIRGDIDDVRSSIDDAKLEIDSKFKLVMKLIKREQWKRGAKK